MNETQYKLKKNHLANKIKSYYVKLEQKKAAVDGVFKAKELARIGREHGKWAHKAVKFKARMAKFQARAAKWNKGWNRRKAEWEHRKDC